MEREGERGWGREGEGTLRAGEGGLICLFPWGPLAPPTLPQHIFSGILLAELCRGRGLKDRAEVLESNTGTRRAAAWPGEGEPTGDPQGGLRLVCTPKSSPNPHRLQRWRVRPTPHTRIHPDTHTHTDPLWAHTHSHTTWMDTRKHVDTPTHTCRVTRVNGHTGTGAWTTGTHPEPCRLTAGLLGADTEAGEG